MKRQGNMTPPKPMTAADSEDSKADKIPKSSKE
jgi:hypothetical protein